MYLNVANSRDYSEIIYGSSKHKHNDTMNVWEIYFPDMLFALEKYTQKIIYD